MDGGSAGWAWLGLALMTAVSWGTYGVFLHSGQIAMGDAFNGRYKAFLFVGITYFFVAVLAPLLSHASAEVRAGALIGIGRARLADRDIVLAASKLAGGCRAAKWRSRVVERQRG